MWQIEDSISYTTTELQNLSCHFNLDFPVWCNAITYGSSSVPEGHGVIGLGASMKLPMKKGFGKTDRTDDWWKGPTAMAAYLGFMIVYATWRGFMESDFWIFSEFGASSCANWDTASTFHDVTGCQTLAIENQNSHVLSPLYSPLIFPHSSWIPKEMWWMSPAMFILVFPAGFRGTCYYYRKAYYRAFFQQPTGCAVSKPWNEYSGERGILVVQNLHRIFMYIAIIYLPILTYDFWLSVNFHNEATGVDSFGLSVGSLVLLLNVILLAGYTFGCHAFRHVVGGGANHWTGSPMNKVKYLMWRFSTKLNEHHKDWALISLFWVMFADFYIWACTDLGLTDMVILGGV